MLTSVIRTVVPVVVGVILAQALRVGLDLDETAVTSIVTTLVTAVYYTVVRFLEERVAPGWGWLLGRASRPSYTDLV